MEHIKHSDIKRMLYFAILLGCSIACYYVFSLDKYIAKISRLDLEILQNVQIMQNLVKSNTTHTLGKEKMIESISVVTLERKEKIGNSKKEESGFGSVEKNKDSSNEVKIEMVLKRQKMRKERLNICSLVDVRLGPVFVDSNPVDILTLKDGELKFVKSGGQWAPTNCIPRAELAVIVPFRNRDNHLGIFLRHMHKFLKTQMIRYRIFVIEQDDEYEFNRGKLMNIGFREALKTHPFNCVVFHDIDLIPEDSRNDYACPHSPRHMSVSVDKFNYELIYEELFGGVEMFLPQDYQRVNGFSNSFWGWGAEDDNLYFRVMKTIGNFTRPSMKVGRYQMLKHFDMEPYGAPNREVVLQRSKSKDYISSDGLSSLHYKVNRILELPLFTMIKVDLQKHDDKLFGVFENF